MGTHELMVTVLPFASLCWDCLNPGNLVVPCWHQDIFFFITVIRVISKGVAMYVFYPLKVNNKVYWPIKLNSPVMWPSFIALPVPAYFDVYLMLFTRPWFISDCIGHAGKPSEGLRNITWSCNISSSATALAFPERETNTWAKTPKYQLTLIVTTQVIGLKSPLVKPSTGFCWARCCNTGLNS